MNITHCSCPFLSCFMGGSQAVTEMRLLVGEEHLQGLSTADCAAGLYYMTAFR